jgi:O-methyltransferase
MAEAEVLTRVRKGLQYLSSLARYSALRRKYQDATMVTPLAYVENLILAKEALDRLDNGAIIECGTWRGGMAAGLMEVGGPRRWYYFFDSFEGMPPAKEIDGERALWWQANPGGSHYYDNCRASVDEFKATIARTGVSEDRVQIHEGFFDNTLPGFNPPQIAILRLDADWYDSTTQCLVKFWDHVLPEGLILIDDYYAYEGCSRAVHDFLSERKAPEAIRQSPIGRVAYIKKMAKPKRGKTDS